MEKHASSSRMLIPGTAIRQHLQTLEDGDVVKAFRRGEERAFQELVSRYQARLLNFIYRTIGDRDKAEDLVQETFIRVYRHIGRFNCSKKFSTWIYTIASNLAKNELRNRARNRVCFSHPNKKDWQEDDRVLRFEDPSTRPDDLYRKRHLKELVEKAVAQLPPHHREVFILRELQGKAYEEICEITSVKLGTVKSRLNRARTTFAEIIEPDLR